MTQTRDAYDILHIAGAVFAAILASYANYGLNEAVDARFDALHPRKRTRGIAAQVLRPRWVLAGSLALALGALALAWASGGAATTAAVGALIAAGLAYNVEPLRLKIVPYVDVLSESVNNPIRVWIGWAVVMGWTSPPIAVLLASWAGGALLMTAKRVAELRSAGSGEAAAVLRPSFAAYTNSRLVAMFFVYTAATIAAFVWFAIAEAPLILLALPLWGGSIGIIWTEIRRSAEGAVDPERLAARPRVLVTIAAAVAASALLLLTASG